MWLNLVSSEKRSSSTETDRKSKVNEGSMKVCLNKKVNSIKERELSQTKFNVTSDKIGRAIIDEILTDIVKTIYWSFEKRMAWVLVSKMAEIMKRKKDTKQVCKLADDLLNILRLIEGRLAKDFLRTLGQCFGEHGRVWIKNLFRQPACVNNENFGNRKPWRRYHSDGNWIWNKNLVAKKRNSSRVDRVEWILKDEWF